MGETLSWWLVVEAMGIVVFPLVYLFFPRLPDRGYAFAKAFGVLIIGYLFWVLGTAWVLPNSAGGIIWTMIIIGVPSGFIAWRRKDELVRYFDEKWTLILTIEALFFLAFIFAAFLRSYVPEIAGTEKPMDFAFLNAATRVEHFPPNDPWLSGHSISYYYGGYFLVAMVGKLAAVDTSIGYNLGLAMTAALAVVGAFGLVYNLVALHRTSANPAKGEKAASVLGWPVVFGLAAAILLVVMANLEGLLEFLAAHGVGSEGFWKWVDIKGLSPSVGPTDTWYPTQHWWWWRAARIVSPSAPETITEFPFFSFLLGDLHPHVMALPFGVLGIAAGLRLLQEKETLRHPVLGQAHLAADRAGGAVGRAVVDEHVGPAHLLCPARFGRPGAQLHDDATVGEEVVLGHARLCRAPGGRCRHPLYPIPQGFHSSVRFCQPGRRHRRGDRWRHSPLARADNVGPVCGARHPLRAAAAPGLCTGEGMAAARPAGPRAGVVGRPAVVLLGGGEGRSGRRLFRSRQRLAHGCGAAPRSCRCCF